MSIIIDTSVGHWLYVEGKYLSPPLPFATEFFSICRSNSIQGSNTDFLICAVAYRREYSIFTTDNDLQNFQTYIPIVLLSFSL
jgi:predicted nuclease of predicted toxin-antitoxin system